MDPHTTQKGSRSCEDCHKDPRAVGLGQGSITYFKGAVVTWKFTPALSERPCSLGMSFPLDAFVDLTGRPLVHTSRPWLRPFNKAEIDRILYVGFCISCHKGWDDPVMASWQKDAPVPPACKWAFDF